MKDLHQSGECLILSRHSTTLLFFLFFFLFLHQTKKSRKRLLRFGHRAATNCGCGHFCAAITDVNPGKDFTHTTYLFSDDNEKKIPACPATVPHWPNLERARPAIPALLTSRTNEYLNLRIVISNHVSAGVCVCSLCPEICSNKKEKKHKQVCDYRQGTGNNQTAERV